MAFLDTIEDSMLATMSTCLHIDWGVLRNDDESLHTDFWKAIEHTLEAEFADLDVVSMGTWKVVSLRGDVVLAPLEHDEFYSLRWLWDPGLYCNFLRTSNPERGGFETSHLSQ